MKSRQFLRFKGSWACWLARPLAQANPPPLPDVINDVTQQQEPYSQAT